MADYSLGTARGEVVIDYDKTGPAAANRDMEGMQRNGQRTGQAFSGLARALALAGVGMAAGIGLAVKSAISFEKQLSGIKAVSGATTADMEKVRSKALQLGKDTKYSATDAALAMEELAKAGVSLPDIMNGAADATVALAAAGEVSLPRAAEIAANAMNVFSLKASDMPRVADTIAGAANASAISVDDFAMSLAQSGAAAALVGVNFEDLTTAIALMGNAGIKGSDAGTSLKTFLQNLQPDTKKQTELFKKLGLITKEGGNAFFDAAGHIKPMAQVAQVLQDSLKGMTDQQKQATLNTLFGSDAIRAAAIIAKGGAGGFNELAGAIGKTKAADVAATRMDNLSGSIELAKGSLETAAITIGTMLIPVIRSIVDGLTGVINAFLNLSGGAQSAILTFIAAGAAMLLVGVAAVKLIGFLSRLPTILAALRASFIATWAAALGPIGIIIAIIAALAVGVFILYQRFQPVRNVVDAVGRALATVLGPAITTIVAGFRAFVAGLTGAATGGAGFLGFMSRIGAVLRTVVIPAIIAVGQFLLQTFGPIITQVISIVSGFVVGIIGYFRSILPQLTTIFNAIVAVVRFAFNLLSPIVIPIIKFIFNMVIGTLKLLAVGIRVLLAGIANIFRGVFNIIGGIVKVFLSVLTGNWRGAWNGIKQIVTGVLQVIKGIVQAVIGVAIVAICVSALKVIGSVFRAGFAAIRSVVTGAINAVRAVITGGMAAARAVVSAAMSVIRAAFSGSLAALAGIARGAINAVVGAFRAGLAAARSVVSGGLSGIVSAVQGLGSRMFSAGAEIIGRLVSGITSRIGDAVSAVKGAVSKVAGLLPGSPVKDGPLRVLNRGYAGRRIMEMLTDGIRRATPATVAQAAASAGSINSQLEQLARSQAFSVMASVGVSGAMAGASGRMVNGNAAAAASGASAGASVTYNATVNNPPPVSGERQVTDALRRMETLYSPFQGVLVG